MGAKGFASFSSHLNGDKNLSRNNFKKKTILNNIITLNLKEP